MASKDILPPKDLKNGPDAQIKDAVMPGELQELKRPVDAVTDRYTALEEAIPKVRNRSAFVKTNTNDF